MSFTRNQLDVWLTGFAARVTQNKSYLTDLDSAIGDADHGANLDRGLSAVTAGMPTDPLLGPALKQVGMILVSNIGGASGPLYGTFFMKLGATLGEKASVTGEELAAGIRAGIDGLAARGRSTTGEKTVLDVLTPACDTLNLALAQGDPLAEALQEAAEAARSGRDATADMVATKGRASYLGERSKGHIDPGAASATYLFESLADAAR